MYVILKMLYISNIRDIFACVKTYFTTTFLFYENCLY